MDDPAELAKRLRLRAARQRKTLGGLSYYSDADATGDEAAAAILDQLASTMSEEDAQVVVAVERLHDWLDDTHFGQHENDIKTVLDALCRAAPIQTGD